MATNLMNILGMLGGQQDPQYGSRAWRERAGQMRVPSYFTPEEQKTSDLLRVAEQFGAPSEGEYTPSQLRELLSTSTDPSVIQAALDYQDPERAAWGDKPLPPYPGGKTPGIEYPYPNVWEEIKGRQEIASQTTKPMFAFPGQDYTESPAGFDPKDVDTGQILLDIVTGKRAPFSAGIPRVTEAKLRREAEEEIRKEERKSPIGFLSDAKKAEILKAKLAGGEHRAFIPAEEQKPDRDGPAKDLKKEEGPITEKPGDPILDKEDQAAIDPFDQKIMNYAKEHGITKEEAFKRLARDELGVGADDLDEFMTDITQRLTEALDRKPGWPEFLMAFALTLQGQDGVSYLRSLNSEYLGRARVLGNLLGEARSEKARRGAMDLSASQKQAKQWDDATGNYHTRMQKYYGEKQNQARSRISDLREVSKANPIDTPLDSKAINELALQRDYWIEMEGTMSAMSAGGKWASEEEVRASVLKAFPKYKELFKKK